MTKKKEKFKRWEWHTVDGFMGVLDQKCNGCGEIVNCGNDEFKHERECYPLHMKEMLHTKNQRKTKAF